MSGYSTGANNRLTSDGVFNYTYDDEGNRLSRTNISTSESTEYSWDFRNRLTQVTEKDSYGTTTQVVEYTYDVFNRRIGKAVDTSSPFNMADAVIERYILDDASGISSVDGGNVVLDFVDPDGAGSATMDLARRYLYGAAVDQLLAQENVDELLSSADRVMWPLVDNLGTVRDLALNDGTLGEHYTYDSYGNVLSGDTSLTRYLYTSREYDADTGLQYNRARWYDPATGRWISEDPIGFAAGDANISRYVGNDLTYACDPSGLFHDPTNGSQPEHPWWLPAPSLDPSDFLNPVAMAKVPARLAWTARVGPRARKMAAGITSRINVTPMATLTAKELKAATTEISIGSWTVTHDFMDKAIGVMQPYDTPSYVDVSLFDSLPADWDWAKIAKPAQSEEHVLSDFSSNILKILNVAPKRLPTKPQVNGAPILPKNPSSALLSTNTSPGTYVYVRDVDGLIHILPDGPGLHPTVLGNGQPASAAGEITIGPSGTVEEINNISFTFQFGPDVLPGVKEALQNLGLHIADDAIKAFKH